MDLKKIYKIYRFKKYKKIMDTRSKGVNSKVNRIGKFKLDGKRYYDPRRRNSHLKWKNSNDGCDGLYLNSFKDRYRFFCINYAELIEIKNKEKNPNMKIKNKFKKRKKK